jgi:serine/threonine-protein kinase RsbW
MNESRSEFQGESREESHRIELKIPASSQWVRVARLAVAGVASRLPFGVNEIEDIKLALTEAVNNAIAHAPRTNADATCISIVLETNSHGLWVSVRDEGRVLEGLPSESKPRENGGLPDGGMGLVLIRSLMDEVEHQSGADADTVVRMFKRISPARARSLTPRVEGG